MEERKQILTWLASEAAHLRNMSREDAYGMQDRADWWKLAQALEAYGRRIGQGEHLNPPA